MAQLNQLTRGNASVGTLRAKAVIITSPTGGAAGVPALTARTTVSVNPASLAAGAAANTTVTVAGALATDEVIARIPATLEAGLVVQGVWVSAPNTVLIRLYNPSAAPVDGAALSWDFTLLRR